MTAERAMREDAMQQDRDWREDKDWQRLDKWLWCARMMKARSDCAALVAAGGLRINRQPTDKPHARLRIGDVVTLPLRGQVLVLHVLALGARRGPPAEAQLLYQRLPERASAHADPCGQAESAAYPPP